MGANTAAAAAPLQAERASPAARAQSCAPSAGVVIAARAAGSVPPESGVFVARDDFYEAITFMEPSRPGRELALARAQAELDLSRGRISPPAGG